MTGHSMYPHILIQWFNLLGVTLLVGSVVFRWAVLNHSFAVLGQASPERAALKQICYRDLRQSVGGCIILLILVSSADLILRAQMMSGKPLSGLLSVLPLVLLKTHLGKVWLGKMAILFLFGILWFFINNRRPSGMQPILLLASAGFCFAISLSGHAADKGDFSVTVAADWLHVMAISAWAGGLVPLRFLLPKLRAALDEKNYLKLETAVLERFSRLAVRCVGILVLTGTYSAWLHLRTLSNLVATPYGITLLFKLAVVAPILGLGALSRYYILPALQTLGGQSHREGFIGRLVNLGVRLLGGKGREDSTRLQRRFKIFVALECFLIIVVLGLTALLTQTSPADLTGFGAPSGPSDMQHMM